MKKSKILVLVAALLVAVMALTACGKVALKDYINPDYDASETVFTTAEKISALKGYTYVTDNRYIAVFTMIDEEDPTKITYKLVSLADASVIATLSKDNTVFTFEAYGPTYLVTAVTTEEAEPVEGEGEGEGTAPTLDPEVTYTLYDVTGTAIATSKYESTVHYITERDYLLYDRVAYKVDVKGALTKIADVPEYVSAQIDLISEDYFYVVGETSITVYDQEFNYVSFYELPDYAVEEEFFLLDNGDYLVQYWIELDMEATKYDLYEVSDGVTFKYDVVTLIVSAEDGSAKEIKMEDYIVEDVITNYDVYDEEDDNNMYLEDSFENIVILYPIEDAKLNRADSVAEMCLMSNKGKVGDSLKLYDDMFTDMLPRKLADNVYVTVGATGYVLVDGEGEVLKRITNMEGLRVVGNYWLGEYAIYSADLSEVVYDIKGNEVDDIKVLGDSIFMEIIEDGESKVVLFANGETKAVYNSKTMSETKSFGIVEEINGYYLYDIAADEYTYYNAEGTKIITTKAQANFFAMGEDTVLAAVVVEEEITYYIFK